MLELLIKVSHTNNELLGTYGTTAIRETDCGVL